MGLSCIGLPASVMFRTVSGTACLQACDWLSSAANRSTGVSRMRVARAVASLSQVVTSHAHGCRAARRLDAEAEDGGEHDDGGVSMAMKVIKYRCFAVSLMWKGDLMIINGHCHSIYAYVGVSDRCVFCVLRVLQEGTYPVFPSSSTASHVDQVYSREPDGKGPGFFPGVDTNQCPGRRGLPHEGLLKLPPEHHTL